MIPIYIGIAHRFDVIKSLTWNSIMENSDADVSVSLLYPAIEEGCTGFSNVRYQIEYGIYLDCDMIVLGDVAELWAYRQPGKFVCLEDGSTEVAVIDCRHDCRNKHEQDKLPKACTIPLTWNVEDYRLGQQPIPADTKLFHFTDLKTQPWFYTHPNPHAVRLYQKYDLGPIRE